MDIDPIVYINALYQRLFKSSPAYFYSGAGESWTAQLQFGSKLYTAAESSKKACRLSIALQVQKDQNLETLPPAGPNHALLLQAREDVVVEANATTDSAHVCVRVGSSFASAIAPTVNEAVENAAKQLIVRALLMGL